MKHIRFYAMLIMATMTFTLFTACSDDDNEGGKSGTPAGLAGRSFKYEYVGVDDDGYPEANTSTITFKNITQCTVASSGYCYVWYSSGYKKQTWSSSDNCRYSVSGDKITIHNYPQTLYGDDEVFTYKGSYLLSEGGQKYLEQ